MGFALVDSINPSCLVTLVVLLARGDGARAGLAFTAGVAATYTTLGAVVLSGGTFLLSDEFWAAVENGPGYAVEFLLGLLILALAWRSSSGDADEVEDARRASSASTWGCAALGAAAITADLPTALPYFAALQIILTSAASDAVQFAMLLGYNVVCASPLLALLALRTLWGETMIHRLEQHLPDLDRRLNAASRGLLSLLATALCLDASSFLAFGVGFLP